MNIDELREVYDDQLRRNLTTPDMRREELPHIVRHTNLEEKWGYIPYSQLDQDNADSVIVEQIEHFRGLGMGFEWKYYSHDTPADLKDRLVRAGLTCDEDEAIMVLDIADAPPKLTDPLKLDIRKLLRPEDVDAVLPVGESAHEHSMQEIGVFLKKSVRDTPDYVSIYAGYDGEQPVAVGWAYMYATIPWAGLYGGGTLLSHRGRGFYTALVAARMQEAQARGAQYLVVDAGPMSKPILERLGFRQIAKSNPCEFHFRQEAATDGKA